MAENPASSAASEPAASSEVQPEVVTPAVDGTAIVEGSWAEADITALTEEASIRTAAQQLASQGVKYAVVTLKDSTGVVYYASQVPAAAASPASVTVDPARVAAIFREEGLIPVAKLAAFRDPAGARADHAMAIGYKGQAYLWLDNKASADGKPWLNPMRTQPSSTSAISSTSCTPPGSNRWCWRTSSSRPPPAASRTMATPTA